MTNGYQLGLIGYPIDHSLSPFLHNQFLKMVAINGMYHLFPVHPAQSPEQKIRSLLERMRLQELDGLNVTVPYKEMVLPLVDQATPDAEAIGAANLIYRSGDCLFAGNADADAFIHDLRRLTPAHPPRHKNRALVLGAGGAARAVVYGLLKQQWNVHITSRRPSHAKEVANHFSRIGQVTPAPFNEDTFSTEYQLIINATTAGMFPDHETSAWPARKPLPAQAKLYDLVYNPVETPIIKKARAAGLTALNGWGMLIEQAAISFEIWTGVKINRSSLLKRLEKNGIHSERNIHGA